jgi:AraC family transcriptional activator of mtrCDE
MPTAKPRLSDFDHLMTTLEIDVIRLAECLISPGWRLEFPGLDVPGLHYNINGMGQLLIEDQPPIDLKPHTLVVVPPKRRFSFIASPLDAGSHPARVVEARAPLEIAAGSVRRFIAGDGEPEIVLICGYFKAAYATSADLFATLLSPIVEQFDDEHEIGKRLQAIVAELAAQEVGMQAMTAALIKQVIVVLLRRTIGSGKATIERFALLKDIHITRAFTAMVSKPGAAHSLQSLAEAAGLSRSVFVARFSQVFGSSPMAVLRELRMKKASVLLLSSSLSVEQVARSVGYDSRSSFVRAFREAYAADPSDYRTTYNSTKPE